MCYILVEMSESKTSRNCDLPSIRDFLDEVTTFMANITFVSHVLTNMHMCTFFFSDSPF